MSKLKAARSFLQQLESVKKQLSLAREMVTSIEAARADAAVTSKEDLERLRKKLDLSQQHKIIFKSAVTVLHQEFELVDNKVIKVDDKCYTSQGI